MFLAFINYYIEVVRAVVMDCSLLHISTTLTSDSGLLSHTAITDMGVRMNFFQRGGGVGKNLKGAKFL